MEEWFWIERYFVPLDTIQIDQMKKNLNLNVFWLSKCSQLSKDDFVWYIYSKSKKAWNHGVATNV